LSILGQQQTAYINYHQQLGHYLVQPLVQSMQQYASAEAVYEAWSEVIRTRDETIRARKLECEWQNELSRREFFTRFRSRRDGEAT
jgi:ATP-dependent RNA circularization protein (DNA/RNA ligase family)